MLFHFLRNLGELSVDQIAKLVRYFRRTAVETFANQHFLKLLDGRAAFQFEPELYHVVCPVLFTTIFVSDHERWPAVTELDSRLAFLPEH